MGALRMTTVELAYIFQDTAVQVQRWRHGKDEIPPHVASYLRLMQSRFAA